MNEKRVWWMPPVLSFGGLFMVMGYTFQSEALLSMMLGYGGALMLSIGLATLFAMTMKLYKQVTELQEELKALRDDRGQKLSS